MIRICLASLAMVLLVGCSKEAQLSRRLVGLWNVDLLELSTSGALSLSGDLPQVGTIQFNSDGTGRNDIEYQYSFAEFELDVEDRSDFVWENSETEIDVMSESEDVGDLVWTVEVNERKRQIWYRTDENGINYRITLSKQ